LISLRDISQTPEDRLFMYVMGEALKLGNHCKNLFYQTFSDVLNEAMQNISDFASQNNLDFKSDLQNITLEEKFETQQLTLF